MTAPTRPLSLAALTVLELTPPQQVECAAQAGYTHIGLRPVPATDTEVRHDVVGDTPLVRETEARLRDLGIKVLDIEILRLKPDTDVNTYLPALETGARLGATYVLVAGNDPDEARLIDSFGALCDLARPLGLKPCIEPMPWTDAKDVKQAGRIVQAAARANGGIIIDPIHFDRSCSTVEDIAALPPELFGYMQFCDAPAERPTDVPGLLFQARCERKIPGEGGLDLAALLNAMPDGIPLSLEIPMEEMAKTANAFERARRAREATLALLNRINQQ
ncbi:sugar phosphate isomerase/epimerase family protein [Noviherbaspirillum denitrificans]|uniref:AP endonuclease n=1 Tax=Noviherbaspirillum denitrificans TaxID=1968433 RepID=A0A254TBK5_9BURK|nr:TIM barrel protein [Noviherbaspirillum denitrificans]OWW19537.1 AP endonuclease [Noviherbaspirillum denitrificans]